MMVIDQIPLSVPISSRKKLFLNMNTYRNTHYQTNNKAKKELLRIIKGDCEIDGVIEKWPVEFRYIIYRKDRRIADVMNIGAVLDKFVSDALVTLGYLPDDSTEFLKRVTCDDGGIDKQNPHARLEISEI